MKRQLFDKANKTVIRSDNGPQFISHRFAQACERFEIVHERIPPKTSNKNAHIESFHAIFPFWGIDLFLAIGCIPI
ncbi:hypothetical protein M5W67_23065, partial [Paenibacillus larvae]|nr:hypothetical protein [Paenibacillus larvae]